MESQFGYIIIWFLINRLIPENTGNIGKQYLSEVF